MVGYAERWKTGPVLALMATLPFALAAFKGLLPVVQEPGGRRNYQHRPASGLREELPAPIIGVRGPGVKSVDKNFGGVDRFSILLHFHYAKKARG